MPQKRDKCLSIFKMFNNSTVIANIYWTPFVPMTMLQASDTSSHMLFTTPFEGSIMIIPIFQMQRPRLGFAHGHLHPEWQSLYSLTLEPMFRSTVLSDLPNLGLPCPCSRKCNYKEIGLCYLFRQSNFPILCLWSTDCVTVTERLWEYRDRPFLQGLHGGNTDRQRHQGKWRAQCSSNGTKKRWEPTVQIKLL